MYRQQGLTLIEVVIVTVILGMISAMELPRFMDFNANASPSPLAGLTALTGHASPCGSAAPAKTMKSACPQGASYRSGTVRAQSHAY